MISFYKAPSAFFPPHKNQRLFWQKNCRWEGVSHRTARFIEENQLLCREDWELFLRQFSFASDDDDRGWRGEYFGKMMRGACMTYQYTENEALYELLRETVQKLTDTMYSLARNILQEPGPARDLIFLMW